MSQLIDALNRLQTIRSESGSSTALEAPAAVVIDEERDAGSPGPYQDGVEAQGPRDLNPHTWLSVLHREYLQSYIRQGGAAIKFAVLPDGESATKTMGHHLAGQAQQEGFVFAKVDARFTKAHMVDRVFHKIAKQLDWDDLAYRFVVQLLVENGYKVPPDRNEFTLRRVAELNERKEPLLRRDLQTWLEQAIENDPLLCREFRMAMIRICLAQLASGESDVMLANSVKEWLCGDLRLVSGVKKALIFQKIARHNARNMLTSLTHWLRRTGKGGLVMMLDVSRYLVTKRPQAPDTTLYYSSSAVLDLYDMLRQFIDASDEIEGFLMIVTAPPAFLTDARRGLDRYEALKLRIWDDVRNKHRQNPLASLVRLSAEAFHDSPPSSVDASIQQDLPAESVVARRIIESLRAGVPNRHVVQALGCPQAEIEGRFRRMLEATQQNVVAGQCPRGMIVEGGFGSGKSHVLEHLQTLALEARFICSRIVIGKETPLYHPARLYHAAIESAVMPDKKGEVLAEVAEQCDVWNPKYKNFSAWLNNHDSGIDSRFAATMFLYERAGTDQELGYRMARFWTGDPMGVGELRRYLKECGVPGKFTFGKISSMALALQRFQFAARLIQAAGYAGWILLIDEAELVGRYSLQQRAKSYAQLARLLNKQEGASLEGLGVVVAFTDDFKKDVLEGKNDKTTIPTKFGADQSVPEGRMGRDAGIGMELIESERIPVEGPTEPKVQEAYGTIRSLHFQAHNWRDWDHAAIEPAVHLVPGTSIREYVKRWITEWDFKRLVPHEQVEIEIAGFTRTYHEDKALESPETERHDQDPAGVQEGSLAEPGPS